MTLAQELGKTLGELGEMSEDEFRHWQGWFLKRAGKSDEELGALFGGDG